MILIKHIVPKALTKRAFVILMALFTYLTSSGRIMTGIDKKSMVEEVFFIPVVVHVVYSSESQNISLEQINSQISVLNQDFRARNEDLALIEEVFKESYADAKIEFVLANKVKGLIEDPIIRKPTSVAVFKDSDLFKDFVGGSDPIQEESILNIWVANLAEGLLGFYDENGVAVDYKSFGTIGTSEAPYNLGRTLTHELGHYLSLSHPWGLGGCDFDDGITDTPNQANPIIGCEASISCGSQDMAQNFMNTSVDNCLLYFTEGQVVKMRNTLVTQYPGLINNVNDIILTAGPQFRLDFYPNPSEDGIFQIKGLKNRRFSYTITSQSGEELLSITSSLEKLVDISHLSSGTYFISINQIDQNLTKKIVIK